MSIKLAEPHGFCAGVARAIDAVAVALERLGAPIYVRKELVHNNTIIGTLRARGAVLVEEIDDVPTGATVVLSAHGVGPEVHERARQRRLTVIDATCPLVTKVHLEAARYAREGRPVIVIGHREHEEVIGTLGYAPGDTSVVADAAAAERVELPEGAIPAVVTQTTLAAGETRETIEALRCRFPALIAPTADDICYATQNRQVAVRELARCTEVVLVIGTTNSSNSNRLREVAQAPGARLSDCGSIRASDRMAQRRGERGRCRRRLDARASGRSSDQFPASSLRNPGGETRSDKGMREVCPAGGPVFGARRTACGKKSARFGGGGERWLTHPAS